MKKQLKLFVSALCCICAALTAAEIKPPEFFKDWNEETHFDFPAFSKARLHSKGLQIKEDPASELGKVVALEFPNKFEDIKRYKEWVFMGIHSRTTKGLGTGAIFWKNVKPGYNWYKINSKAKLTRDCYMYFFTTWILQMPLGSAADITFPEQKYELWVRAKFTGPTFPQGKKEEKDAIYIERVVLKKIK